MKKGKDSQEAPYKNTNYFIYKYTDPAFFKRRAFVGNGYMGMDVSSNFGQGFGITENQDPFPVLYIGGVYSYTPNDKGRPWGNLNHIFRAMNLFTLIPKEQERDEVFDIPEQKNFSQEVNLRDAIIRTLAKWYQYDYEAEFLLLRNFVHFGILKTTFSEISNTNKDDIEFYYLAQKNPLSQYEKLVHFEEQNVNVFDGYIEEEGFDFLKKGPFHIIQTVVIKVVDEEGTEIPYKITWKSIEDIEEEQEREEENKVQEGEVACPGELLKYGRDWIRQAKITIKREALKGKNKVTFFIYMGVFHDYDLIENNPFGKIKTSDLLIYAIQNTKAITEKTYEELKQEHRNCWEQEIWNRLIETEEEETQRRIIASMYQLGCSFKEGYINSAGPTGLNNSAWGAHIFWDADLWINLGLLMWAPELSRCITAFRSRTIEGAKQNREKYAQEFEIEGLDKGIKFPWQSCTSGREVAPIGWEAQEHVNCDVVFGQYLYYKISGDDQYLRDIAYPLAVEVCKYLQARIKKEKDGKYHYRGVIPADEFVYPNLIDDDAFTNLYVARIMEITIEWSRKLGKEYPKEWEDIKNNMFFNYDEKENLVIEYTGYKGGHIKQADVNLLTFPLEWSFKDEVKRKNMLYYFDKLPENKIMMSSSIFSIIASELGMKEKAWEYFVDLFKHYHPQQVYIASESPVNTCYPFITGVGGFLSVLINGFAGIRIRETGLFINPSLPDKLREITYNMLFYQDKKFRLVLKNKGQEIYIKNLGKANTFTFFFPAETPFLPSKEDKRENTFQSFLVDSPLHVSSPRHPSEVEKEKKEYQISFKLDENEEIVLIKQK